MQAIDEFYYTVLWLTSASKFYHIMGYSTSVLLTKLVLHSEYLVIE